MLQVNFIMTCIIHKMSVLLKIIPKCFLRGIIDFYFLRNSYFFSQHIMMESSSLEEENIIKDVRNLLRLEKLKKETIYTPIKCARNLFRLEKEDAEIKDRILRDIKNVFRLKKEKRSIKDIILRNIRNIFETEEEENYY